MVDLLQKKKMEQEFRQKRKIDQDELKMDKRDNQPKLYSNITNSTLKCEVHTYMPYMLRRLSLFARLGQNKRANTSII